jgi:hypothetical protein
LPAVVEEAVKILAAVVVLAVLKLQLVTQLLETRPTPLPWVLAALEAQAPRNHVAQMAAILFLTLSLLLVAVVAHKAFHPMLPALH